jgi:hypothetical protein
MTQQNDAMVEQSTTAYPRLAAEAEELAGLVGGFRISDTECVGREWIHIRGGRASVIRLVSLRTSVTRVLPLPTCVTIHAALRAI